MLVDMRLASRHLCLLKALQWWTYFQASKACGGHLASAALIFVEGMPARFRDQAGLIVYSNFDTS